MVDVPWVVRFVDMPEAGRTTRLDLNDEQTGGQMSVDPEGFSLGTAEMTVATAESMLQDGTPITARKRVNRELTIPVWITGNSAEVSGKINALAREVDRQRNYLEFKPSDHTGESIFFTVLLGDVEGVDLDPDVAHHEVRTTLTLHCEPLAVGLPVSGGPTLLSNEPGGTQQQTLALPAIKGDVAAPLNVTLVNTGLPSAGVTGLVSVRSLDPGATPVGQVLQAEGSSPSVDTSIVASGDSAMSGAAGGYARTTFATNASLTTRIEWLNLPSTFGTFKVLVRVRKSTAGNEFDVRRYLRAPGGNDFFGPTVRYGATSTAGPHWLDLGQVTFPAGGATPPGTSSGVIGSLRIEAARITGTGTLDFDVVRLLPVEIPDAPPVDTAVIWQKWASTTQAVYVGLNSEADEIWTQSTTGVGFTPIRRGGLLPRVHPGRDNYITVMRHVGTVGGGTNDATHPADSLTWSTEVSWSYRPRWLYISESA